jgi:putative DNA methylase
MEQPKKLIEVAMPIKEISAESVRDKSIRHGHISTLHLWWARRPLPVCRAVVFASLVPDPLDPNCPQAFRDAVEILLGKENNIGDPYSPYEDIPWTSIYDPMEDNLRNRLQLFIGKFSPEMEAHLLLQKPKPGAGKQLTDQSLIKWDNKNDEKIIGKARKLIWVAHNSKGNTKTFAKDLIADFDKHYKAIIDAELELYNLENRHLKTEMATKLESNLELAKEAFLDKMPKVFDPFAGGGAIPLEAARLGCRSYGNDINPVAHIIQKGSLEFPQKYGKPIIYSKEEFVNLYGEEELLSWCKQNSLHIDSPNLKIEISNRLSFDVAFYAKKLLAETEKEVGYLYPSDKDGNKPIAYYWARVGTCSNPSCKAEVPLFKQFYIVNTATKKIYVKPEIKDKEITFTLVKGVYNEKELLPWNNRGNLTCPCCNNVTDVKIIKDQFKNDRIKQRLIAVITESNDGKNYRLPSLEEISLHDNNISCNLEISEVLNPCSSGGDTFSWNVTKYRQLFLNRQLFFLQNLIEQFNTLKFTILNSDDYNISLLNYLAILVNRIAVINTSFGVWHTSRETVERIMSRQSIGMVFDYPESNPFCNSSGSAINQIDWIIRYIDSESQSPFYSVLKNSSSGEKNQFVRKELTAVVTDPPYYDAIAYADLSDFFYLWLKRTLGDIYPENFATPQTPKTEECTALKHHHNNHKTKARLHFENKLLEIFKAIEFQTSDIVSIMFAHQSTEAWTTLCNSILKAEMNITGSWATDTEMTGALKKDKAFLSSSVTVSCVPTQSEGCGDYKEVKKAIETTVAREVNELYKLGFRGADLLTACFGQAVREFGKYKKVEKADGSEVTVAELLEMARESAFNALLKGFDGDEFTKFYIGWLQLNGFTESDFDDAAKFVKVGLSINVQELFTEHILIKNGNKQTLGNCAERIKANKNIGDKPGSYLIDQVQKAMYLYKGTNRGALLKFISEKADAPDNAFWRVVTSLDELLPKDCEDQKLTRGLLSNKNSLIRESKDLSINKHTQGSLEL